jgi:hypothetical protein
MGSSPLGISPEGTEHHNNFNFADFRIEYPLSSLSLSKLDSSDDELYFFLGGGFLGEGFLDLLLVGACCCCFPGRRLGGALVLTGSESESEESLFHVLELKKMKPIVIMYSEGYGFKAYVLELRRAETFFWPLSLESLSATFSLSGSFRSRPDRRIP